jgi:tRNA 2-selenouridine synthase
MSSWNDPELINLFSLRTPLIDVRAPIEFREGVIPFSVNMPIMTDEERHLVGICYKERGQDEAIKLGHQLVSGKVKEERVAEWKAFINQNANAQVFCFRGGLRSQISCQWITEAGVPRTPIKGGYKRLRHFFLSWLEEAPLPYLIRIGGFTGSGKTTLLRQVPDHIDLEDLANHRGSAFGPRGPQPSQISFENQVALNLMELREKKQIIVEDESATLGMNVIPPRLFTAMRSSSLIILQVSFEERIKNIFEDYVKESSEEFFLKNLERIRKKLGNTRTDELASEIRIAFSRAHKAINHETWISILLKNYYDPLYLKDLRYNKDKIIFEGTSDEVLAFLNQS